MITNNEIASAVIHGCTLFGTELTSLSIGGIRVGFQTKDGQYHWFFFSRSRALSADIANHVWGCLVSENLKESEDSK